MSTKGTVFFFINNAEIKPVKTIYYWSAVESNLTVLV